MRFTVATLAFATAVAAQYPIWTHYDLDQLNDQSLGRDDVICNFSGKTVCIQGADATREFSWVYECDGSNWKLTTECAEGLYCQQSAKGQKRNCRDGIPGRK